MLSGKLTDKDYFCIPFCSNLMCNIGIFVSVKVEFLAFNVLLHTKSEQKVIGNLMQDPGDQCKLIITF